MAQANVPLYAFNRGLVSRLALARTDIGRVALSAETMTNWTPRVLGPMSLRPGLAYLGSSFSDATARYIDFVFSTDDTALIELTDSIMRVWVDDTVVSRPTVTTSVVNSGFDSDVTSWTDADEAGATSQWATGGYLQLTGTGTAAARRYQLVSVPGGSLNIEHGLAIAIHRGPVTLRVGSTLGGDEYINETELETGVHSLSLTPGGNFYIDFSSRLARSVYVDSCTVESAGAMTLVSPWLEDDLDALRYDQSADVVFVADGRQQQRRIERRAERSWSLVLYHAPDGPFRDENTGSITVTPNGLSGNITLTASSAIFRSSHVGAIWKVRSAGQQVAVTVTGENQFSDPIRVFGVDAQRRFSVVRTGTWSANVRLQRSLEEPGTWVTVATYTTSATVTFDDGLDNQIAYYRIGVPTGDFTSGTASLQLTYSLGSISGIARVTAYTSGTLVSAEVLRAMGGTAATTLWSEGEWSDLRGWPSAVSFHEGRLWWAGGDKVYGSVSDAFDNFDLDFEGDAGPIIRSIGSGPVDTINWIMSLQRLILGAEGAEFSARSSSFDEPLTPSAFALRSASTQGSAGVDSAKVDKVGIFVQRSGQKVYQLAFSVDDYEYSSTDLTLLDPDLGSPGIVRVAVQRQPDTRIHCVRSDGKVIVLVFDVAENVRAWWLFETDGLVEDAVVLPDVAEDAVYYSVRRTINSVTKRYLERWAMASECVGGTLNKQADSFVLYSGAATTTITGLSHLEGESVVVWGGGVDLGTKTVASGQITGLSSSVTSAVIGLPYTAQFKSTKLAYAASRGAALTKPKQLKQLGVILADTHAQGLQYGPSFSRLDNLPRVVRGATVNADTVHAAYDEQAFTFPGSWDTDSRLCLQATAPRPVTVLAAIIDIETSG